MTRRNQAVRDKEQATFAASEEELTGDVDTLERAIGIIEKELAGSSGAFAQDDAKDTANLVQALSAVVEATGFLVNDNKRLSAPHSVATGQLPFTSPRPVASLMSYLI